MRRIFASHFTQYSSMFGKFFNIPAFFRMWNGNGSIAYFHISYPIFFANS